MKCPLGNPTPTRKFILRLAMETPLKAAFGELAIALGLFDASPNLRAEVTWAALHGLAVLRRGGRIPPEGQEARLDLLVSQIVNDRGRQATQVPGAATA